MLRKLSLNGLERWCGRIADVDDEETRFPIDDVENSQAESAAATNARLSATTTAGSFESAFLPDASQRNLNQPWKTISATTTPRKTMLTTAFSRKNATLIQFKLRRRAIQCSSTRQPAMIDQPMR